LPYTNITVSSIITLMGKQLQIIGTPEKLYIKTPLQCFLLQPKYREKTYYLSVATTLTKKRKVTISEILALCDNRVDIIAVEIPNV
jgi:hypothetical protein